QSIAFGTVEHFIQPSSELSHHAEHAPPIALRLAHDPGELHRYRGARCRNEKPISQEAWIGSVQKSNQRVGKLGSQDRSPPEVHHHHPLLDELHAHPGALAVERLELDGLDGGGEPRLDETTYP